MTEDFKFTDRFEDNSGRKLFNSNTEGINNFYESNVTNQDLLPETKNFSSGPDPNHNRLPSFGERVFFSKSRNNAHTSRTSGSKTSIELSSLFRKKQDRVVSIQVLKQEDMVVVKDE